MANSRGGAAWRAEHWGAGCATTAQLARVLFAGTVHVTVRRECVPAFDMLARVFAAHGYAVHAETETVGGGFCCRALTGHPGVISAHAQGIALDVNPSTNPYRTDRLVTDMQATMIAAVYAIRTCATPDAPDGVQVFRWGGDWDGRPDTRQSNYDAMHFEVVATPAELSAGLQDAAVPLPAPDASVRSYPVLRAGARGPAVGLLQRHLAGTDFDGIFGPATAAAVVTYQREHGLTADGVVGPQTWTALLTQQPVVGAGVPSPIKLTSGA